MNDIEAIRPRRLAISDKYSVNLYRYAKKWREWGIGAYACDRNLLWEPEPFDRENPKPGRIVIGRKDEDGWMSGSRLNSILTSKNCQRWAFVPRDAACHHDVSEWFWPEYVRIGRALWDSSGTSSMHGDDGRWDVFGNSRRCTWSGRVYTSHVETIQRGPIVRTVWTRVANDNADSLANAA